MPSHPANRSKRFARTRRDHHEFRVRLLHHRDRAGGLELLASRLAWSEPEEDQAMNRRRILSLLAGLPFVGLLVKPARGDFLLPGTWTVTGHDQFGADKIEIIIVDDPKFYAAEGETFILDGWREVLPRRLTNVGR